MDEGMEKTTEDEEVGCRGRVEVSEGMDNEATDDEGTDEEALIYCLDSRGGRGSWDCWPVEEEDGDGSGMDDGSKRSGLMKLFD